MLKLSPFLRALIAFCSPSVFAAVSRCRTGSSLLGFCNLPASEIFYIVGWDNLDNLNNTSKADVGKDGANNS